jgi:hypothetical protein
MPAKSTAPSAGPTPRCASQAMAVIDLRCTTDVTGIYLFGEDDQPRWRSLGTTRRAEGTAPLVARTMVIASGIGWPVARAASSHVAS